MSGALLGASALLLCHLDGLVVTHGLPDLCDQRVTEVADGYDASLQLRHGGDSEALLEWAHAVGAASGRCYGSNAEVLGRLGSLPVRVYAGMGAETRAALGEQWPVSRLAELVAGEAT